MCVIYHARGTYEKLGILISNIKSFMGAKRIIFYFTTRHRVYGIKRGLLIRKRHL